MENPQPPPRQSKKSRNLHSQSALSRFWYRYHSRNPGKITSIFPKELYKNVARGCDEPQADKRNTAHGYEKARGECLAKVRAAVDQCERTNAKFCDGEFDIDADFCSQEMNCLVGLIRPPAVPENSSSSDEDDNESYAPRRGASSRPRQVKHSLKTLRKSGLLADKQVAVNMRSLERYMCPPQAPSAVRADSNNAPKSVHRVDWIFENPKFTVDGFSSFDIKQGGIGDCWWLAAVANIAHRRDLMEKICVARDEECGVYGFVFHRDGEWISTVIDDNLYLAQEDFGLSSDVYDVSGKKARQHKKERQTGSEALFFAKCDDENETWLPLLEKAYAKVHGDYCAIEGGWAGAAVEDLTGGVTTVMLGNCILRKDKLWREMVGVDQASNDFVFALSASGESGALRKNGLVLSHAYSILKATEIQDDSGKKLKLLKIKNPWGQRSDAGFGVWHGPWSDGSKQWTPEVLRKLNHEFADDGVFWMAFDDVLSNFKWIHRTRLFDERWTVAQQWMSTPVSWVPGYLRTKFVVEIKNEGMVVIVLSNLDQRYFEGLEGMYCFSLEFRLKSVGSASVNFLVSSKVGYNDIRSINCEVYLQPGTYEVLPRVTASDRPWGQPVEQVVKEQARFNPVKLRQVGLRYDLAHAKAGVLDEDETQKTKRQKKRAKQKARAKDAQTNPNGYLEQVVQQIVTTVQEEVKKLIIGDNKDVKGDDKERDEKSSQRKQVSHEFTKSHPGCSSVASIVDTKDKPVREIEPGSSMERTASMTEENTRSTIGPEKPVKGTVPEPEPSPPPPLVLYNNTPIPVGNGGLKSDSDSDPDSDRWSDSDSDTDIVQAEQRWNPVCVMCLRVYAHDKEVSIKLVEEDDAAAGNGVAPVVEANA